jgi:hypothetical protein
MPWQTLRLPDKDAAGTAENATSTTETQIGTGLTVPDWAHSITHITFKTIALALTTKELINGYFRITNDKNTIDPLNFPMPQAVCLTGAIGTHISPLEITFPCYHDVDPTDIVRVYFAEDADLAGLHTHQAYLTFSSEKAPINMKCEKSAVIAGSATANTRDGAATINTIADRTKAILGFWNSLMTYPTAAQTFGGYIRVKSSVLGWLEQIMPTSQLGSGLSTQITPLSMPSVMLPKDLLAECDAVYKRLFPREFPMKNTRTGFDFENWMDGTNTVAPSGRYGLIYRE